MQNCSEQAEQDVQSQSHFVALLDACVHGGPQIVTQASEKMAVLIKIEEWERLKTIVRPCPSLKDLLLTEFARTDDLRLPEREKARHRKILDLKD